VGDGKHHAHWIIDLKQVWDDPPSARGNCSLRASFNKLLKAVIVTILKGAPLEPAPSEAEGGAVTAHIYCYPEPTLQAAEKLGSW
jgi:hypothetical protein